MVAGECERPIGTSYYGRRKIDLFCLSFRKPYGYAAVFFVIIFTRFGIIAYDQFSFC